jgi:E3 ubiquitin-protein ligase CCNP1IP1
MNPSEAFKSSVLSGLRPEIIMDICGRALSFWIYQSGQEMFFQQMLYKNLDNQYAVLKNQFNSLHSQTGQEFQCNLYRHY